MRNAYKLFLMLSVVLVPLTPAEDLGPEAFQNKMYSLLQIHRFGVNKETLAQWNRRDKLDLLAARDTVVSMMRAAQLGDNPVEYLAPDFAARFKTQFDFIATLIPPETSILATGITDFDFLDEHKIIKLGFLILASSEGTITVSESMAYLEKIRGEWRITKLESGQ